MPENKRPKTTGSSLAETSRSRARQKKKTRRSAFAKPVSAVLLLCISVLLGTGLVGCTPRSPDGLGIELEESYAVVSWEPTKNAVGYTVEYDYGDATQRESRETAETFIRAVRYAGTLRVRVSAKTEKGDSDFSEWKTFDIPAIPLPAPQYELKLMRHEVPKENNDTEVYWKPSLNWGWVPVTVRDGETVKTVEYYQVATVAPNADEEAALQNAQTFSREELFEHKFYFTKQGTWRIYVRPVNYTWFNGQIVPEPEYLYRRYCLSESWRLSTVEVNEL